MIVSPQFNYVDSSQEQIQIEVSCTNKQKKIAKSCRKICSQNQSIHNEYEKYLETLLNQKQKHAFTKMVLVDINDKQIQENFQKRKKKYEHFLEYVKIDNKYNKILQDKIARVSTQNLKKKIILDKVRTQEKMAQEEKLLHKHLVQKQQLQTQMVQNLKKKIRKMGIEDIINSEKQIKKVITSQKQHNHNKLTNLSNVQQNALSQLKQQLNTLKQAKKVNKLEQQKTLKEMQKEIELRKQNLETKLKKSSNFIF